VTALDGVVLVTGAAGFIGSELVSQLHAAGRRVVALDNLATGSWSNLEGLTNVRRITGDVRDARCVADAMTGVSTVFHLACLNLRHSIGAPLEDHDVNATGTMVVLEAARRARVGRVVHVSSCEVYGTTRTATVREDHPTEPTTPYGASKLAGEASARAFHLTYGLPVVIVRPFNTYGPRSHAEGTSGEVIPRFFVRALAGLPLDVFGDGEQTRDFTYVGDTARGIFQAGLVPEAVGRTFNMGSGREVRINDLAHLVSSAAGCTRPAITYHPARPGDVGRLVADASLARGVLGFDTRISFADGLASLTGVFARGAAASHPEIAHNWRLP
jgi:UDP-glucose 4-epimerase